MKEINMRSPYKIYVEIIFVMADKSYPVRKNYTIDDILHDESPEALLNYIENNLTDVLKKASYIIKNHLSHMTHSYTISISISNFSILDLLKPDAERKKNYDLVFKLHRTRDSV